jgi:hypothetical protein
MSEDRVLKRIFGTKQEDGENYIVRILALYKKVKVKLSLCYF